ncbi:MAG: pilus assembly FimT family protein [Vicinamibacterales bacterium]
MSGAGDHRAGARPRQPAPGFTLLELLFTMTLMIIVAGIAVPQTRTGLDRARAIAAARSLAHLCAVARFQAVGRARHVAVQFTPGGDDFTMQLFADGNRNGVRTSDIRSALDPPLSLRTALSADYPGVRIALDPGIGLGSDPVRLSGSSLLSFSPAGTATAGTVYVLGRDGTQLAVRVLGVTGRTRVLRYERSTGSWERP